MSPRKAAFLALALASAATLGSEALSYGLVYPARATQTKAPLLIALFAGALGAAFAALLSCSALRRSSLKSERFLALLGALVSAFLLFVVLAGFGIPELFLGARD